jgi:hypothetical protein
VGLLHGTLAAGSDEVDAVPQRLWCEVEDWRDGVQDLDARLAPQPFTDAIKLVGEKVEGVDRRVLEVLVVVEDGAVLARLVAAAEAVAANYVPKILC